MSGYAGEPIESVELTPEGIKFVWAVNWYSHKSETFVMAPNTWRQLARIAQAGYEKSVQS